MSNSIANVLYVIYTVLAVIWSLLMILEAIVVPGVAIIEWFLGVGILLGCVKLTQLAARDKK